MASNGQVGLQGSIKSGQATEETVLNSGAETAKKKKKKDIETAWKDYKQKHYKLRMTCAGLLYGVMALNAVIGPFFFGFLISNLVGIPDNHPVLKYLSGVIYLVLFGVFGYPFLKEDENGNQYISIYIERLFFGKIKEDFMQKYYSDSKLR